MSIKMTWYVSSDTNVVLSTSESVLEETSVCEAFNVLLNVGFGDMEARAVEETLVCKMLNVLLGVGFGDLEARAAETDAGNCRACLTASMSPRARAGWGEFKRGGRGGAGEFVSMLNMARGGGGRGPAIA